MYTTNSAYTINEFVYLWNAYCREMETFLPNFGWEEISLPYLIIP
jgi:hypothetical protein